MENSTEKKQQDLVSTYCDKRRIKQPDYNTYDKTPRLMLCLEKLDKGHCKHHGEHFNKD